MRVELTPILLASAGCRKDKLCMKSCFVVSILSTAIRHHHIRQCLVAYGVGVLGLSGACQEAFCNVDRTRYGVGQIASFAFADCPPSAISHYQDAPAVFLHYFILFSDFLSCYAFFSFFYITLSYYSNQSTLRLNPAGSLWPFDTAKDLKRSRLVQPPPQSVFHRLHRS